jgi:UDP-GlcNAc:undecaprenyl-phosphate GlcNAc-1-phosphate transferase
MFDTTSQPIINLPGDLPEIAGSALPATPLTLILPLIAALVVSMVVIPVMVRLAPRFNLLDEPDVRKVHAQPVPRVGGFGIFFGAIVPLVLLLPMGKTIAAFLAGAAVLFAFGVLDDSKGLGHYVKFIGQFLAVAIVVYWGDVYVTQLPFMQGEAIGDTAGRLFTVVAMVGMINAINHSDGLDGLAGGEALLSLCCIAWLSFVADGFVLIFIALSLVGGLLGFMRYNTYPAIIFMGDGGSQFVGYTLGFLAVMLTQQVNPALSPALPALILGLPIADIIAVFAQRIYRKMNWFRASRNHIHHRLLDLGFHHYESVVVIYTIQTILVVSAVMMPYEADAVVLGLYLAVVAAVFLFLFAAERRQWRVHAGHERAASGELVESARLGQVLTAVSYWGIAAGLSLFLVAGSLIATRVPPDFTLIAMVLCGLMLVRMTVVSTARFLPLRALCYMTIAFVVYLANTYQPAYLAGADPATYIFFGVMVLCIAVAIRYTEKADFNLTPTDFLVIIAVGSLAILSSKGIVDNRITAATLKAIILFYGCELVLNWMRYRWNIFTVSTLIALIVVSLRGMGLLSVNY